MPNILNPKVVIIWEHELRAAIKSMKPFESGGKPTPQDAETMIRTCFYALYSPELANDEDCGVTIMACRETVMVSKTEIKP